MTCCVKYTDSTEHDVQHGVAKNYATLKEREGGMAILVGNGCAHGIPGESACVKCNCRVILLCGISSVGFVFQTNLTSPSPNRPILVVFSSSCDLSGWLDVNQSREIPPTASDSELVSKVVGSQCRSLGILPTATVLSFPSPEGMVVGTAGARWSGIMMAEIKKGFPSQKRTKTKAACFATGHRKCDTFIAPATFRSSVCCRLICLWGWPTVLMDVCRPINRVSICGCGTKTGGLNC